MALFNRAADQVRRREARTVLINNGSRRRF
jgi:hypothetical protein